VHYFTSITSEEGRKGDEGGHERRMRGKEKEEKGRPIIVFEMR